MSGETIGSDFTRLGQYGALLCPMPDCGEQLYINHESSTSLYTETLVEYLQPQHADVSRWKVECLAGHVLLVPLSQHDETATFTVDCEICNDPNELGGEVPHHNDVERLQTVLRLLSERAVQP